MVGALWWEICGRLPTVTLCMAHAVLQAAVLGLPRYMYLHITSTQYGLALYPALPTFFPLTVRKPLFLPASEKKQTAGMAGYEDGQLSLLGLA